MQTVRQSWTDDRLDDLRGEMHRGFARVDADMREIRAELGALQRTMVVGFAALGGGLLASIAATVLTAFLG